MADLNKIVDDLSALTILEAAELKKLLEERWGVTAAAAMPMMAGAMMAAAPAGGAAAPAEEAEEQTEFKVVLVDVGPKKINVIKAVRAITDLGLKEAKDLVEADKPTVVEGVSKEAAADAKAKLEAEGAKVEVK
jgi:large subunit ribosomal protein L7/L12